MNTSVVNLGGTSSQPETNLIPGLPRRTVLVLGAGASTDYGYPLWKDLRNRIDEFDFAEMCKTLPDLDQDTLFRLKTAHAEYREFRKLHCDWTLDTVLHAIDVPKTKHQHPTGPWAMKLVAYLLWQVEMTGKTQPNGWVSELRSRLVSWLLGRIDYSTPPIVNPFDWLSVISLNYDRSFEYHLCHNFFSDLLNLPAYKPTVGLPFSRALSARANIAIYQPHGTIGRLHSIENPDPAAMRFHLRTYVEYADVNGPVQGGHAVAFKDSRWSHNRFATSSGDQGFKIFPVDDQNDLHYGQANFALGRAELVFCLGLSPAGITQSRLQFPEQNVPIYASNRGSEIAQIKSKKPGLWEPLVATNDAGLLAVDFPEAFARKVLLPT